MNENYTTNSSNSHCMRMNLMGCPPITVVWKSRMVKWSNSKLIVKSAVVMVGLTCVVALAHEKKKKKKTPYELDRLSLTGWMIGWVEGQQKGD